ALHDPFCADHVQPAERVNGAEGRGEDEGEPPPARGVPVEQSRPDDQAGTGDREPEGDHEPGDDGDVSNAEGPEGHALRNTQDTRPALAPGREDGPLLEPRPFLGHDPTIRRDARYRSRARAVLDS